MTSALRSELARLREELDRRRGGRIQYAPQRPTERQKQFLDCTAFEALYGGAAGGGKSSALLMAALQYVHVPRYAALIFRRTYADLALPGAIMDRAKTWLVPQGVTWNEQNKRFTFPSGATLTFAYLDSDADRFRYQGAELQFCPVVGTPILMADGSYRAVEEVRVGDLVATLDGPRPVSRAMPPRKADCVAVDCLGVRMVVSDGHKFLTPDGWVAVRSEPIPIESRAADSNSESSRPTCSACGSPLSCSPTGPRRVAEPRGPRPEETDCQATDAFEAGAGIDCATCCGCSRAASTPPASSAQLVLHARAFRQAAAESVRAPGGACVRGCAVASAPDSARDCRGGCGSCDERPRHARAGALGRLPSRVDAAEPNDRCSRLDGLESTRSHTREHSRQYCHPYTSEGRDSVEPLIQSTACISPAGEREVVDLTVAGASHYVSWGGFISQNCGFDELTQFPEGWYRYLLSRIRRNHGHDVPLRVRAATNPGGVGHEWVKRRFIDDETRESRVFVPASLRDNPYVDSQEYEQALYQLDPTTRRQLLDGIWVRDTEGLVYQHTGANIIDAAPELDSYVLGIDYGFTDATAFTVCGWRANDPVTYIVRSYKRHGLTPSDAAEEVKTLQADYGDKVVRIVGDAGGLGKGYIEEARQRWNLPIEPADKANKRGYISLFNGALFHQQIKVVRGACEELIGEWNELPWNEDRSAPSDGFEDHCADSATYGWRACLSFTERVEAPPPVYGSREWFLLQEQQITEQLEREVEAERDGNGWMRDMFG